MPYAMSNPNALQRQYPGTTEGAMKAAMAGEGRGGEGSYKAREAFPRLMLSGKDWLIGYNQSASG